MKDKIAVLGPKGTFTDIATCKYIDHMHLDAERAFYSTMRKTFSAVGTDCNYGVIPIENTLDGYVQIILDLLATSELKVIHEIVLPIRFAFVANCAKIDEVETIYVQFKSENQCTEFLETFEGIDIITTASNSQSYNNLLKDQSKAAAIIPMHMLEGDHFFSLVKEDVADSLDNHTRFIVISKELNEEVEVDKQWKTSIVVTGDNDRPGLLADILGLFSSNDINMKSIMSRPTKSGLGNYNFFIDIDGCYQKDPDVRAAISHVLDKYQIKILGSFYRVGS